MNPLPPAPTRDSDTPNDSSGGDRPRGVAIPDYELLSRIGSGAYGEVWLARGSATGVLRAIKIVRRETFTDERPFNREFDGIKKFEEVSRSHPSQLAIFHVGRNEAAGCFYYVMELADAVRTQEPEARSQHADAEGLAPPGASSDSGPLNCDSYRPRTLRSDLSPGRLPAARVLELGLTLTEALAHLHSNGLVHRDVKPSNIIFVGGRPKLADIGLVTDASDQCSVVGTEGYIAPEGPGAPQADVFALGKVLYEALTGLDRRRYPEMPAEIRDWPDRTLVFELNEIILKACAADARQRYATTEAMLADLRHLAEGRSVKRRRTWQQTRRLALQLGVAAALVFAGWPVFQRFNAARPAASASVFVLPFRGDGTNAAPEDLRGRMTDAFINSLKLVQGVEVAQRRSTLADRPLVEARAEAARLFGVRYVLTGRLKSDDALMLSLDLLEAGRELPVWSQTFTGTTNRLIELESQAIPAVATALGKTIPDDLTSKIGQVLTNNLAAWRLVQQADRELDITTTESLSACLQHYNEALILDPEYVRAMSRKAQFFREQAGNRQPNEIWTEIKGSAARMLLVDLTSSDGQYFRWITQFLHEWKWVDAETTFQERRARQADGPVVVALYLRIAGRFAEARAEQEKVKGLDQRDLYVRNHTAAAAFVERDYPRSIVIAQETRVMNPDMLYGLDWLFHGHYHLSQFDQALESVRQARRLRDAPVWMTLEACALAKLGQRDAALELLGKLEAMPVFGRYVDPYPLAWVHLALGDKPAALTKLREACQMRSEMVVFPDLGGGLRTDPKLDELRNEPEFQELLKLAGLDVWPIPEWKP